MSCSIFVAIVEIWGCQSASVWICFPPEMKAALFLRVTLAGACIPIQIQLSICNGRIDGCRSDAVIVCI